MKTSLKISFLLLVFAFLFLSIKTASAQCAQCAAAVKTNKESGTITANGLNNGILFLLCAPYVAVGIGGYVWYKKYKRKNVELNIRSEKLNLN